MFWVELSYPIATPAEVHAARSSSSTSMSASHLRISLPAKGEDQWPAFTPALGDYSPNLPNPSVGPSSNPSLPRYDTQATGPPHISIHPRSNENIPKSTVPQISLTRSTGTASSSTTPMEVSQPTTLSPPSAVTDPLRVLVVDDDAMTRTLMTRCA